MRMIFGKTAGKTIKTIRIATVLAVFLFASLVWRSYGKKADSSASYIPTLLRLGKVTRIYNLADDQFRYGQFWMGTDAGAVKVNRLDGSSRHYGLHNGLPSETVSDVLPLRRGVLLATWNGLVLLDPDSGKVISYVSSQKGFSSDRYFTLIFNNGLIYAGGDRGIDVIDTAMNIVNSIVKKGSLARREVYALSIYGKKLYAGHDEGQITIIDNETGKVTKPLVPRIAGKKTVITDILAEKKAVFFTTTDAGVWRLKENSDSLDVFSPSSGFPAKGAYAVSRIDNELWYGTAFGIVRSLSDSGPWLLMRDEKGTVDGLYAVTALDDDADGVWLGLMDKGLYRLAKEKVEWTAIYTGLTHDLVKAIGFTDNTAWFGFGYLGNGLDLFDIKKMTFRLNRSGSADIPVDKITKIKSYGDFLFLCSYEGLLIRNSKSGQEFDLCGSIGDVIIRDVTDVVLCGNRLWIASLPGLHCFDFYKKSFIDNNNVIKDAITQMAVSGDTIYAATLRSGVQTFSAANGSVFEMLYFDGKRVDNIALLGNGLYASLSGGDLAVVDNRSESNKYRIERRGILDSAVVSVLKAIDNTLWVGTKNHGIVLYNDSLKRFATLDYRYGLINNDILSMECNDSRIWIGLAGGVASFERREVYNVFW